MTVGELHLEEPRTIDLPSHGMRSGIPVVEISDQGNRFCGRRGAIEVDGLGSVSRPITIDAGSDRSRIHSVFTAGGFLVRVFEVYWSGAARGSGSPGLVLCPRQSSFALALGALRAAGHKRARISPELHALLEASRSVPPPQGIQPCAIAHTLVLRFLVAHAGGPRP
jgi:hypothetical protein